MRCRSARRSQDAGRWTDRTGFLVERDIMISAYAIRRLNEARKLSDDLASRTFTVRRHALVGGAPDAWGRHEVWKHYDLENGFPVTLGLPALCNQVIHSWIWMLSADATGALDGVFVSSDRERRRGLYFFSLDLLTGVFTDVGEEDIVEIQMRADERGERQIVRVIAGPPNR